MQITSNYAVAAYPGAKQRRATTQDAVVATPKEHPGPPSTDKSTAAHKYATRWLTNVLNMAAPDSFASDTLLASPDMALALHSPMGAAVSAQASVTYQAGNLPLTAEGRAQAIINELGNGTELALSDAIQALVVPNPGRKENARSVVETYFRKEDTDRSGALSQTELTKLISYYDEMAGNTSGRIQLPSNWA